MKNEKWGVIMFIVGALMVVVTTTLIMLGVIDPGWFK